MPKDKKATKKLALPAMNATAKLTFPIKIDGAEVTELKMRRPTLGDQLRADKQCDNDVDTEITLIANLCEVTPSDLEKLDLKDYQTLQENFKSFLS